MVSRRRFLRRSWPLVAASRVLAPLSRLPLVLPAATAAAREETELELFNGRNLDGWLESEPPGAFRAEAGELRAALPGPVPSLLRTAAEYENFVLTLDYLTPGWCEAGIVLFAPPAGGVGAAGAILHLRHNNEPEGTRSLGALYDVNPPLRPAGRPAGEWNQLEVVSDWPHLRVRLNGQTVQDINRELRTDLQWRLRRGHIGLLFLGSEIRFRRLRIRELPGCEPPWIRLDREPDLSNWTVVGEAPWRYEQGLIIAESGDGYLVTRDSYSGFIFEVMVRTSLRANGGVFFRWEGRPQRGYEVQIYNLQGATNPTGSIYGIVPARRLNCRDGEWLYLQLVSDGATALVSVNGERIAESHELTLPDRGHIALQMHSAGRIEFLRPRVRLLSSGACGGRGESGQVTHQNR